MDKEIRRQMTISLHTMLGHITSMLHYIQEDEDKELKSVWRMPEKLPRTAAKVVSKVEITKKQFRSPSSMGKGRQLILSRLKQGPARWVELQAEAQKQSLSRYVITNSLVRLKEDGIIKKTDDGWVLADGSSV